MTTMRHDAYDYNTAAASSKPSRMAPPAPSPAGGTMTIFPLGFPQGTRRSLDDTQLPSPVELIAEIICQAIAGFWHRVCTVSSVPVRSGLRQGLRTGRDASVRAERAARSAQARALASQEKAGAAAQKAVVKAEKAATVPVPTQPEAPPQTDPAHGSGSGGSD